MSHFVYTTQNTEKHMVFNEILTYILKQYKYGDAVVYYLLYDYIEFKMNDKYIYSKKNYN
jgi:hypothetical protein